jgi:hypothetical protein
MFLLDNAVFEIVGQIFFFVKQKSENLEPFNKHYIEMYLNIIDTILIYIYLIL